MEKRLLALVLKSYGISQRAVDALYEAGYTDIKSLREAFFDDIIKIDGIGKDTAKALKKAFLKDDYDIEERSSDIFICTGCGAFISARSELCEVCGEPVVDFTDEEEEEDGGLFIVAFGRNIFVGLKKNVNGGISFLMIVK